MFFKKSLANHLISGGIVFFVSGIIANILNYLYRVLMGRMLTVELFGELVAIVSLTLIFAVPSAPFQVVAVRFSAVFEAGKSFKKIKEFLKYLTKVTVLMSLGLIILVIIFARTIQNFLNLSSISYVYFLAGIVAVMLIAGVTKGILQGIKRFSLLSYTILFESVGRVGLAVILVVLGFKMAGALGGFLIPLILGYFLTIYFLQDILKLELHTPQPSSRPSGGPLVKSGNYNPPTASSRSACPSLKVNEQEIEKGEIKEIWGYAFWSLLAFFFLNILLNVDIILVKHYFSAIEAGIYSGFATLGHAAFIAISLLGGILFPVVAFKQAKKEDYFYPLKITSLISFLVGGIGVLILFLFPKEFLLLFFGNKYLVGAPFLGYYGLVMGLIGLIFLLSYFFMALNKFKFLSILALGSILEIFLIRLWHSSFLGVISMFFSSLVMVIFGLLILLYFENKTFKKNL